MDETHPLCVRLDYRWRKGCGLHRFNPRTVREAEKTGFEPFSGIYIARTGHCSKVGAIKSLTPIQIGRPQRDMFNPYVRAFIQRRGVSRPFFQHAQKARCPS